MPKVSVVTCSHNRPELLRKAIESLRAQTDPDWEHLIYDDHSTDPRVRAVLEWAAQDPRVRVWLGQENIDQPSRLWNYMLDRAHGRYFTVLDDDNEKLPTFVAAMSHELDADPTLDVVTCGWRMDYSDGTTESCSLNMSTSAPALARMSTCDGGAMLYRRSALERVGYFSEAMRTSEDWDWLRRAAHVCKIKNLPGIHATYRSHGGSRMHRADALGRHADTARVCSQPLETSYGVTVAYPSRDRLTASQKDVCDSVERALGSLSWIAPTPGGMRVVVSPFQMSIGDAADAVRGYARALSWHMEDPYALAANSERVRAMKSVVAETWVCTNDASTVAHYQQIVGDRVLVCPTLGPDTLLPVAYDSTERDIDALFCGYAYPSRQRFMAELLPLLDGLRVVLVGDGWESHGVETMTTQSLEETYRLHRRARAVICAHRLDGDCGSSPLSPSTVNRGAMEGYGGARVFIDQSRAFHSFDEGDVVWYDGAADLALKLRAYLDAGGDSAARAFAEKCAQTYSYRTRLVRAINSIRAERRMAEIP